MQAIVFKDHNGQWFSQTMLVSSVFTALLCMSIIVCLHPWRQRMIVPLPLLGIVISSIIVPLLQIPVLSLEHFTGGHQFDGGWESLPSISPFPHIPVTWETFLTIFPAALGMSTVSIMETIVTQKIITDTIYKEMKKEQKQQRRLASRLHRPNSNKKRRDSFSDVEVDDEQAESDSDNNSSASEDEGSDVDIERAVDDRLKSSSNNIYRSSGDSSIAHATHEITSPVRAGSHSDHFLEEDQHSRMDTSSEHYDGNKLDYRQLRLISVAQDNNQAIIGVGIGNFMAAMFGGFGGCPLLPKTILNIVTGGRGAISTASYALSLMAMILFFGPLLGCIPMAALTGVMFSIAYETLRWKESFKLIQQSPKSTQAFLNTLALLLTSYLSFAVDMGLGVIVGVLVTKLPDMYLKCSESVNSFLRPSSHPKVASS